MATGGSEKGNTAGRELKATSPRGRRPQDVRAASEIVAGTMERERANRRTLGRTFAVYR